MKILENEPLSKHTTFKMGGIANKMFVPENRNELCELVREYNEAKILAGGSNLLINDSEQFPIVIDVGKWGSNISQIGNLLIRADSAVRTQSVINYCKKMHMGGIEYLYSVPGTIGGAIYMNAGRGVDTGLFLGNNIVNVEAICTKPYLNYKKGDIVNLDNKNCEFAYRKSLFQNNCFVILSADINLERMDEQIIDAKIKERLMFTRKVQDLEFPNYGSVFSECNPTIMKIVKHLGLRKGGCVMSNKTSNWMLNRGGTYQDAIDLINMIYKMHRIAGKRCVQEVCVWE